MENPTAETPPTPLDLSPEWREWPRPPKPGTIKAARTFAGLTQAEAARLTLVTVRTWQKWEAGDSPMRPGLWAYFCARAKAHAGAREA